MPNFFSMAIQARNSYIFYFNKKQLFRLYEL